jgi:hypothetical protein
MNAVVKDKPSVQLTVSQQKVEEYLKGQEEQGRFLLSIGAISQAMFEQGKHQLADFTIRIENDPKLAEDAVANPGAALVAAEGFLGADAAEAISDSDSDSDFDHEVDDESIADLCAMLFGNDDEE